MAINQTVDVTSYSDFQGLARLKTTAKSDPRAALKTVAQQFETQFISMMLKSMRDATPQDGLMDSQQGQTFQGMMDKEVAQKIAAQGGIGLAGMIQQQLKQDTQPTPAEVKPKAFLLHPAAAAASAPIEGAPRAFKLPERNMALRAFVLPKAGEGLALSAADKARLAAPQAAPATALTASANAPKYWDSPEAFVNAILPHAEAAAKKLGIPAQVLVAQSALETGWGKHLPANAQGGANYNFFGIKADASWQGAKQTVNTLEFEGGAMVQRKAAFRAYDSVGASFNDFVQFLHNNPRYSQVLAAKGNPENFARELQKAGYATDPQYADKLIAIMRSGRIPDSPVLPASTPLSNGLPATVAG
ncbi:MAG: flagellar rod assembly protein/muramidase FlgJ [Halothiobacillus sp. 24-54-40]|jgi:flagellar protein FlgJ|nr:MAG: flagellar rod assembly protein/muramidase FlgJ [Halothiobacillus sp. 35-54-62]OYY53386.1 MAG: flagellar rod assembly protein/muramidase FlgJ [Halothiobacillus sp. 28-55-5]OYZ87943.1 MAG: flagellar rod assembly protein/muramidase FlgJ [Halothiobacillus sp. 24-54-40]OZA81438.1 MAG: flagellar rod assembly protein/muramidase FlgJ [Halothiobacillus sp. 39-53-45]HQS02150.1 flagellar assembly peptidoglycan hydrolase FlgJ [Halothiobacillus sp.]